ncbi:MAG TPA: DUF5683 domain-containing protein, partial [Dongiaceae bacterium]|nr:DUF5683 domain-containing protein [Dongiaceae bacterium]
FPPVLRALLVVLALTGVVTTAAAGRRPVPFTGSMPLAAPGSVGAPVPGAEAAPFAAIADTTGRRRAAPDSLADTARVQGSAPNDTVAVTASGRVVTHSPVDTVATHRKGGEHYASTFDQPRFVMMRSLLFPGWGQYHNRAYWKAGAVALVEGYLIGRAISDELRLRQLQDDVNRAQESGDDAAYADAVTAYNDLLDASVSRLWLLGGVVAYAMLDAYVDAHFVDFDVQFKEDPALRGRHPDSRVELGVRWRF